MIIKIVDKVDELLAVLDRDIQHIQESLSRLNELRSLVIKRDDVSLGKLLESTQRETELYKDNERKRQLLREELAVALGCDSGQVTLSKLEAELPRGRKAEVTGRRVKLRTLAGELKREHLNTALLLSDCTRFNRVLLRSIFEFGRTGTITYNPRGSAERQTNTAFVNLQF